MPKARKRKLPIAHIATRVHNPSTDAQSCRTIIRQFHILLKRRRQLETDLNSAIELAEIDHQISSLGGLERYQQMSALGQREERGGGSEKIFIRWMKDLNIRKSESKGKVRLLEVGALMHDNYQSCSSWIEWMPIDLNSRHPQIIEQDFLLMELNEHRQAWDAISLSLVVNFVPEPADRGRMLKLAYDMLVPDGFLFLALPLPCVANSRYMTFDHLKLLMESLGFKQLQERWRTGGKMGYWLYQKKDVLTTAHAFSKKIVLRDGQRNNFAIIVNP
ncbi:putative methyltransferase-domain-containing protein [Crassisporium funariophilum]|nr:putative methyltransferase-domain-containing protein [Crassisporium funariophilum]